MTEPGFVISSESVLNVLGGGTRSIKNWLVKGDPFAPTSRYAPCGLPLDNVMGLATSVHVPEQAGVNVTALDGPTDIHQKPNAAAAQIRSFLIIDTLFFTG
jgi:hypothetical protein